jgi:membrane protease YdiL (CAAX protease family)
MPPPQPDEFLSAALGGVVLLLVAVLMGGWAWALSRLVRGRPLLSESPILPLRPARWGGGTVSVMILLYVGANLVVVQMLGPAVGLKPPSPAEVKEDATRPAAKEEVDRAGPAEEPREEPAGRDDDAHPPESDLALMVLNALASVLFVLALPAALRRTAGVEISELGFSRVAWPRQVAVGVAAALLATPAVYAIHISAGRIWETNRHPVDRMMTGQLSPGVVALAFVSTVFLAPLVEESMFRGVLLGWLTKVFSPPPPAEPASSQITMAPVLAPDESAEPGPGPQPTEPEPADLAVEPAAPARNVVCLPAIVLSSLLFAGLHMPQWPAPIGIFFLSLALGVVYQRTGSLLTAMVMHGVFNGCSTILFLVGTLARSLQVPELGPEVAPRLEPAIRAVVGLLSRI